MRKISWAFIFALVYACLTIALLVNLDFDEMTVFWGIPGYLVLAILLYVGLRFMQAPHQYRLRGQSISAARKNGYLCVSIALGGLILLLVPYIIIYLRASS